MSNLKNVLEFILAEIKKENDSRKDGSTISTDDTTECLANIFHDAGNKFSDIDFDIEDDEECLVELFGDDGFNSLREYEQGIY